MKLVEEFKCENDKINKLLGFLLITAVVLIPFDNLPYFNNILGELSYRGAVYPSIIIILLLLFLTLKNKSIYFKKNTETILLFIFITWVVISTIFNFNNIMDNSLKGRSGISKLILQFMVCGFMLLIAYTTDIIIGIRKIKLQDLRKFIAYSLIPVFIYGTIELINLAGLIDFSSLLEKLSYLLQTYHRGAVYTKGIRTVTGEVSYFAMYISFALPWITSYIFTEKERIKKVFFSGITMYLIILIVFSKSRAAYAILFLQIFIFTLFILVNNIKPKQKLLVMKAVGITIIAFFIINTTVFSKIAGDQNSVSGLSVKNLVGSLLDKNNMSNVARMGMQSSAIKIGMANPIVGVGLGQFGFETGNYLTSRALESNEVKFWIDPINTDGWPPAFSLYPRIVAEVGIVGIVLWFIFIGYITIKAILVLKKKKDDILGIALIVSFIGILISWWNADTFGLVSFWILLPFMIRFNGNDLIEDKK